VLGVAQAVSRAQTAAPMTSEACRGEMRVAGFICNSMKFETICFPRRAGISAGGL
jgi:hypothetical protein